MTIKFQQSDCIDIEKALGREWLETNGIGGYASSSISGCNTRRYHGLLVARLERPAGKFVLLSRYEESLYDHPTEQSISTAQYPGKVQPDGYRHMASYSFDKTPVFTFRTPHVNLTRRVAMISGRNAVFTKYECTKNPRAARLVIRPLLAYRDFHALTCQNVTLQVRTFPARQSFKIQPYEGMPPLFIQTTGRFEFFPSPVWYRHVEYAREMERGFPFQEDLFSPGMFEIDFPKGAELLVSASTTELSDLDPIWEREMNERSLFFKGLRGTAMQKTLRWSAQQFLSTKLSGNRAITAGFPWFLEWGRDAMIALPGLLLDGEKNPDYLDVLKEFSANMKDGVVPNFLGLRPDDNAYNSADASLWFAWAVQQYLAATGDYAALKGDILNALDNIFDGYSRGTLNDIRMLDNGLIRAGSYHTQLTWMDANSNGMPVTPRNG